MTTEAADQLALLVQFSTDMGTPTDYRYTTSQGAVTHSTLGTFQPLLMDITMQDLTGRADDDLIELEVDVSDGTAAQPLQEYGSYPSHAPVEVTAWVVDLSDVDNTAERLWFGRLVEVTVNAGKQRGIYKLKIAGPKRGYVNRPAGISCTSTCVWRFGDSLCGYDTAAEEETVTVDAINGQTVTVSPALTAAAFNKWTRGRLQLGGLALTITENLDNGGTTLTLTREPPPTWLGASVTASPGCDKSLPTCRNYNNEARFAGFGYAMPNADPRLQGV